jgi:hypothetical protein
MTCSPTRRNRHDLFAIVQPDLALNAHLTHCMRIGVTAGYRSPAE